ncbi:hypothetical protein AJ80_03555 [Polytolypa hystricis UAMH7299]|uniref:J domain-containing protein n=1 Tax=Polytolypa hystricis (strain UAMH7299) TaxID=1447883 RepID=A0A2B7YGV6_POLH7|nr:hypothetical protein AJ80_03555 [Polytolypa hystricis UAMH7299]
MSSSPPPIDPYQILGVAKDASTSDIRSAYRKLVLKCHPDKIKDEAQRIQGQDEFQKVQEAYELLSDDTKRARYNQKVRLAELRKEVLEKDREAAKPSSSSQPSSSSSSSKSTTYTTTYEYRGGTVYEERVPTGARFFDDDIPFSEEPRASSRKYDGYERKSASEDKKKRSKQVDPKVPSARATKERNRDSKSRSDRVKNRDRERKREVSDKYTRSPYIVSENESDSDDSCHVPKRSEKSTVYEERPSSRRSKTEPPRRPESRRSRDAEYSDGWESSSKLEYLKASARDYISSTSNKPSMDYELRPAAPMPPVPAYYEMRDSVHVDSARRSSARRQPSRDSGRPTSSGRERRGSFDILDPALRGYTSSRKIPSMPTTASAPSGIKIPVGVKAPSPAMRSATAVHLRDKPPAPRRSETLPIPRRSETMPSRPSKLKDHRYDSGYSSPGTPEMHQSTSPSKASKIFIVDEDEDYSRGHRTVLIDPTASYRRHGSVSPARQDRPPLSVRPSSKTARSRTTAYAYPSETMMSRESPSRHESSRSIPTLRSSPPLRSSREGLFGEVMADDVHPQTFSTDRVRFSPSIRAEDISFSQSARKGSLDSHLNRDGYPRPYQTEYHRPGMVRA